MKSFDVIAWHYDGAVYCDGCKPNVSDAEMDDNGGPVFADDEESTIGSTCDACGACYVAGEGWTPHDAAVGDGVTWFVCNRCNHHHPTTADLTSDPPECSNCGYGRGDMQPSTAGRHAAGYYVTPHSFDRLDICEAWSLLAHDWGLYAVAARLDRMSFKPAPGLSWRSLSENGRAYYLRADYLLRKLSKPELQATDRDDPHVGRKLRTVEAH